MLARLWDVTWQTTCGMGSSSNRLGAHLPYGNLHGGSPTISAHRPPGCAFIGPFEIWMISNGISVFDHAFWLLSYKTLTFFSVAVLVAALKGSSVCIGIGHPSGADDRKGFCQNLQVRPRWESVGSHLFMGVCLTKWCVSTVTPAQERILGGPLLRTWFRA